MADGKVIMIVGPPASGKSTLTRRNTRDLRYIVLNRDTEGGKVAKLLGVLKMWHGEGHRHFILDNTHGTAKARKPFIDLARELGMSIEAHVQVATIEQCQFLAARRMVKRYGQLLDNKAIKDLKGRDPNMFPPIAQYAYFKRYEEPSPEEGFDAIHRNPLTIGLGPEYVNKAVLLDYDGTLRETHSGEILPRTPDDVRVLPNRTAVLRRYEADGYRLLGVSNQSGCSRDPDHDYYVSPENAEAGLQRTDDLLGVEIEHTFCPHKAGVPQCYCGKPMPGRGVEFIEKYKLNPSACVFVGDLKSDETFARRCGFQFVHADEFFKG